MYRYVVFFSKMHRLRFLGGDEILITTFAIKDCSGDGGACLVNAQERLRDAKVVDHLSDTEKRGNDNHPAKSAFEECLRSFVFKYLGESIDNAIDVQVRSAFVDQLQSGLDHVSGVD